MSEVEVYTNKRKEWLEALNGDDPNSIRNQLLKMSENMAFYMVIAKAIDLTPNRNEKGEAKVNGMIVSLITEGFKTMEAMRIRKVVDKGALKGKNGVYSLRTVVKEIINYHEYITRRTIFEAEGLEYDLSKIEYKKREHYCKMQKNTSIQPVFIPRELADLEMKSKYRHKMFDEFCGFNVMEGKDNDDPCIMRRDDDRIDWEILDCLLERIDKATKKIIVYANKWFAHSSIKDSRECCGFNIDMDELYDAQTELIRIATFVTTDVLGGEMGTLLPIMNFEKFEYLDEPLVPKSCFQHLEELWGPIARKSWECSYGLRVDEILAKNTRNGAIS